MSHGGQDASLIVARVLVFFCLMMVVLCLYGGVASGGFGVIILG